MKWILYKTTDDGRQSWRTEGGYPHATIYKLSRHYEWSVSASGTNNRAGGTTTTKTAAQRAAERALKKVK